MDLKYHQMHFCKMNKPLPEISTEIKTDNNQSINQEREGKDGWNFEKYLDILRNNTDYHKVCDVNKREKWDEILNVLSDVCLQNEGKIMINQTMIPIENVKNRIMSLDGLHMEYIIDSLSKVSEEIRNIRSYIITTSYNAPTTIKNHYSNMTNADFRKMDLSKLITNGGGWFTD